MGLCRMACLAAVDIYRLSRTRRLSILGHEKMPRTRSTRRHLSPYAGVATVLAAELETVEKRLGILREVPKAAFLGSARVRRGDPYWTAAHDVAARFASGGWWIITGGGPGIMEAAATGAGLASTIALRIQLIDSLR